MTEEDDFLYMTGFTTFLIYSFVAQTMGACHWVHLNFEESQKFIAFREQETGNRELFSLLGRYGGQVWRVGMAPTEFKT